MDSGAGWVEKWRQTPYNSVSAIPMTVVIDKSGTIIFATLGACAYLEEALELAVKEARKK